jgi:DNA-binding HxlR family transcriptional regulator
VTSLPVTDAPAPTLQATGAALAIEILGDAWVLRILRTSFRGARRFGEFMDALQVSRAVLSDRLGRLVQDGLLDKLVAKGRHPEYRLSDKGLDLWRVLVAMWQWEVHHGTGKDRRASASDRPRHKMIHRTCGATIDPVCSCRHCRVPVSPFDTHAVQTGRRVAQTADESAPPRKRFRKPEGDGVETLPTLLRLFGDRLNAKLMAAAFQGHRTFSELAEATGLWPGPLTVRIEELQGLGLIRGHSYAGSRLEYRLTRVGIATFPITLELLRWGDKWLWAGRPPLRVMHRPCGKPLQTGWYCPHCQAELQRRDILQS